MTASPSVVPALIVVDDPNQDEAGKWVRKARRLGVPVASIHDGGIAIVESDLVIDGGISPVTQADRRAAPARTAIRDSRSVDRAGPCRGGVGRCRIAS